MKELSDEEIQKMVEAGMNEGQFGENEAESIQAYAILFDGLKSKPTEVLRADFADSVVQKIENRKSIFDSLKFYFLILILITIFFAVALATFIFAEVPFAQQVIIYLEKYKEEIVFAVTVILVIQILDKLLIRNKLLGIG